MYIFALEVQLEMYLINIRENILKEQQKTDEVKKLIHVLIFSIVQKR